MNFGLTFFENIKRNDGMKYLRKKMYYLVLRDKYV